MKKKEFFELVKHEAEQVRRRATPEEKARLDYATLQVLDCKNCLRGQLCGGDGPGYLSERAEELMPQYIEVDVEVPLSLLFGLYNGNRGLLNFREFSLQNGYADCLLNPLEIYILLKGAKNRRLVEYLKGKRETFEP